MGSEGRREHLSSKSQRAARSSVSRFVDVDKKEGNAANELVVVTSQTGTQRMFIYLFILRKKEINEMKRKERRDKWILAQVMYFGNERAADSLQRK